MNKEQLIDEARERLKENSFDEVHGEKHHELVWENCQKIIEEENLQADKEVLQVAAMWHDVERGKADETKLLKDAFIKYKVPNAFGNKVLEIIDAHSFGKNQESVEAKILFDADKLEYVNPERGRILLEEYQNGKVNKDRFDYYVKGWQNRIIAVREQIHFKYSKNLFEKRLIEFMRYASDNSDLAGFTKGFVV
jgi:HD superfamily phosphodiesterase